MRTTTPPRRRTARAHAGLKPSGQVRIGISGWTYRPWRGVFYPPQHPQKRELAYASRALNTIEINGTFYSLQCPSSFQKWRKETPDEFLFSVKGGRFITHLKDLRDVDVPLANFFPPEFSALRKSWARFSGNFRLTLAGMKSDSANSSRFSRAIPRPPPGLRTSITTSSRPAPV